MKTLALLALLPSVALAQEKVSTTTSDDGRTVNINAEGNLESQRKSPLQSMDEASSQDTPVDFFDLCARKLESGDADEAAKAFLLASAYGSYDSRRVADKTAHQAIQVLILEKLGNPALDQKNKFQEAMSKLLAQPDQVVDILKKFGKPAYHPKYMIQHGMGAFSAKEPGDDGLVKDFNADAAWNELLAEVAVLK
jgi:hypothetical protein